MTYKLKQKPEDFIVREKSSVIPNEEGSYSYFLMKKTSYNTLDALSAVAKAAHCPQKIFGFAGTKDRNAVTEQMISFKGSPNKLESISLKDIELKFIGKGETPLSLGDLEGNYFEITVRNIEKIPNPNPKFLNLFGEQRFSSKNVDIGRAIVKKDFEKACGLAEKTAENNDYVGALRKIHKKLLKLYVHAYQSWIWNTAVIEYSKDKTENEKFPIPGFGEELEGEKGKILQKIMKDEEITCRDFIIRKIPEISAEGDERDMFAEAKGLEIGSLEEDELNKNMKKARIKFFLQKGSYATEFIRQLFQSQQQQH